jgi:hypothetical protein
MTSLYYAHPKTLEYLVGKDSEASPNDKYTPETHALADKYRYNHLTSSILKPPDVGKNERQILINEEWLVVPDFRGKIFYNTLTQEQHQITELDKEPDPAWTDQEPTASYQVWSGNGWIADFGLWLDQIIRPQRDVKMAAFEWRLGRHDREIRLGLTLTDDISILDNYMQDLADFPSTLSAVIDPIPWPELS